MRIFLAALCALVAAPAAGHVTVWPKQSSAGAGDKYEFRVPNEKQVDMTAVDVRFPDGLKVSAFEQKPGWSTELLRGPSGQVVGARWTGRLPPQQFAEFGVLAVNPAAGSELVFTATQAFADGSKVEWSGRAGSKTPAPRVTLIPASH